MVIAYIFGYGSLVNPDDWAVQESPGQAVYGWLQAHYRHFRVGIDNQSPDYDDKHYLYQGQRAQCIIGTLGINPRAGSRVNGLAIPVDQRLFERISAREKSYFLSPDLRELFSAPLQHPLFTYYPRRVNQQLYVSGRQTKNIFLPQSYLDYCWRGFSAYQEGPEFLSSTERPNYQIADLEFYRAPEVL